MSPSPSSTAADAVVQQLQHLEDAIDNLRLSANHYRANAARYAHDPRAEAHWLNLLAYVSNVVANREAALLRLKHVLAEA